MLFNENYYIIAAQRSAGIAPISRPKYKSNVQQAVEHIVVKTGMPHSGSRGITNPIKLNISDTTLSTIKKRG